MVIKRAMLLLIQKNLKKFILYLIEKILDIIGVNLFLNF